jgi:hypothetical protein
LLELEKSYANTHTEDDMTGEVMTKILHKSLETIKAHVKGVQLRDLRKQVNF